MPRLHHEKLKIDQVALHVGGFLQSFKKVKETTEVSVDEYFLMKCMCKDIFCWLTGIIETEDELAIPGAGKLTYGESRTEILYRLSKLSIVS